MIKLKAERSGLNNFAVLYDALFLIHKSIHVYIIFIFVLEMYDPIIDFKIN